MTGEKNRYKTMTNTYSPSLDIFEEIVSVAVLNKEVVEVAISKTLRLKYFLRTKATH